MRQRPIEASAEVRKVEILEGRCRGRWFALVLNRTRPAGQTLHTGPAAGKGGVEGDRIGRPCGLLVISYLACASMGLAKFGGGKLKAKFRTSSGFDTAVYVLLIVAALVVGAL